MHNNINNKGKIHVIILAAGKGTRMKSSCSKVMHTIADLPMVEHVIRASQKTANQDNITVVLNEQQSDLTNFLQKFYPSITPVIQHNQLGTGHAVKIAYEAMVNKVSNANDSIIILYGDTPFITEQTIIKMLEKLKENAISLLVFEAKDAAKYGRIITQTNNYEDENNLVQKIVEFNEATTAEKEVNLCNSGVIAFNATAAPLLTEINNHNSKGEYYLTDLVEIANKHNLSTAFTLAHEQEVMGVNSQEERARAESIRQNTLRQKHMENGVVLLAPESCFFSEDTFIDNDVIIEPNVQFYGSNIIKSGARIRGFSYIENASIGEGCIIGPYARIRPKTELSENVKIGNFVEIKNAKIESGAKVNHLSYIGDAEIGEETNIGAGVITCNYDGANKHKTTIGKNCFIGSNSEIIAPKTIGNNVLVAAGTTVLKDIESNNLALNKKNFEQKNRT